MVKTLILGNNPKKCWITNIENASVVSVPNISIGKAGDIISFIRTLPKDLDCIIIDADSLNAANNELSLDLALYIRLMLHDCRQTAMSNIIIVSDLSTESYKGYGVKSMVLMTQNVSLVGSEVVSDLIANISPLTPGEYVEGFLRLIKIEPQEKLEGRHSIANQWGAQILAEVISAGEKKISTTTFVFSSYFLYSSVVSLNAADVQKIINNENLWIANKNIQIPGSFNYLLIDDEAEKGWEEVLKYLMPQATAQVWRTKIKDYDDIAVDVRKNIEKGKFDIIFLDLRMSGIEEESNSNPANFSGMKILKKIKDINPGIQIIMLTATNKGWNVKAMIDAGADGYYMKESPEYHFPLSYSEQNALALKYEIEHCLTKKYLKNIYNKIKKIDIITRPGLSRQIENQLLISFDLINKANSKTEVAFAYIALEQVFEIIAHSLFKEEETDGNWTWYFKNEDGTQEECDKRALSRHIGMSRFLTGPVPMWIKIAAIYYLGFNGLDEDFGKDIKEDIQLRNNYIHETVKPIITSDDYQNLFDSVFLLLSVIQ